MKKIAIIRIKLTLGIMAVSFLAPVMDTHAQNNWITLPGGKRVSVSKNAPVFCSYTTEDGKLKSLQMKDPQEVVKVIVTLKDKPLAHYKKKNALPKTSLAAIQSSLRAVHFSVKSKLSTVVQQLSARTNFQYRYTIRREYYTALNGIAIECNRELIDYLHALPEVENVAMDREVKINLKESVHQIRADVVQDSLGYKGDSVLVGEIDTGIDYDNPALGGGFGPGFRVIGGHDFANNDNDPMDDNGHGTHVAGIIGADGGDNLRGVAPHVEFLAVKVLDNKGIGTISDVIAGIEYCMDPDGDPTTDDAVDIMNMSLGGLPSDNSPDERAVDNATQAGILSVIAAGNDGLRPADLGGSYETICSPGSAVTALTVGACDRVDRMASFSSRGPDPMHFAIKPEVVAPGVDILSTIPNNGTASWSGTSMATPHVTGVAALLKQQHKDWSPGQLKAVIVNSAKPLSTGSPYVQGNGRVDALNAATLGIIAQPGVLSLGLVDLSQDVWIDTVEFTVKNLRTTSQNVNLELQGGLPPAITVSLSQTSFTLTSMQETGVTAIISVPKSVPILNSAPYAYTGTILCRSDSDKVQIPVGFVKSNVLIIDCDFPLWSLILLDQYGSFVDVLSRTAAVNNRYTLTMAGGGRFDLTGIEHRSDTTDNRYFFFARRNVNTKGLNFITLNHSDAIFSAFGNLGQMRDIHDNPVGGLDSAWLNFRTMIVSTHGTSETVFSGFTPQTAQLFLDTMESSVSVGEQLFSLQGDQALLLAKLSAGVNAQDDLTLPSGSQNLGDLSFKFDYENSTSPIDKTEPFLEVDEHEFDDSGGRILGYGMGYNLPDLRYVHLMSNRNPTGFDPERYISMSAGIALFNVHYFPSYLSPAPIGKTTTSDFIIAGNGDIVFVDRKPFRPDLSEYVNLQNLPSGDTVVVQENWNTEVQFPKFQFLYAFNNSSDLGIMQFTPNGFDDGGVNSSNGMSAQAFANPNASVYRRFTAQMFAHNRSLQGASLWVGNSAFYDDYTVNKNSDRYRLLASAAQYNLLGQVGQTTIDYEFKVIAPPVLALRNCFLPSLDLFQILGDGRLTQWLRPEQDGTIRLVIFDPKNNVDSAALCLLKNDGTKISLTTTDPSAKEYVGTIPKDIPDGFLDVSATVHNTDGNTFHLTVSPAFYHGASIDSVQFDARVRMGRYTLNNVDLVRFNAGDTLRYTLAYANYGNYTARNISVHFPRTDYFTPVGDTTVTIDSIRASAVERFWYRIPLMLVFLGKKQPAETQSYYTPSITWNSGGRLFSRKHSILVDFSGTSTHVAESGSTVPQEYALSQNYPNPFNPTTTISFDLPSRVFVSLKVFDLLGREVATIISEELTAGTHSRRWNSGSLASGVYFYQLRAGSFVETKKLLLVK